MERKLNCKNKKFDTKQTVKMKEQLLNKSAAINTPLADGSNRRIALFGSTGSIGRQALEVIASNSSLFSVEVLTAYNNEELLIEQALRFNPNIVVIGDEKK